MTAPAFDTPIPLDRDLFMRQLIANLGHLNEGILGSDVAGAYIMNVGLSMGSAIEDEYKRFWHIDRPFTIDEYAHVIIDLKQKIHGNFSLVSMDADKVVVRTTSCPFDEFVRQSPSLCFMTSSVFGGIAARNFGWSKVVLHRRIAIGDDGCYVTVWLRRTAEAQAALGKEYAPDVEQASPDIGQQLRLMDRLRQADLELGEVSGRWEEVVRGAGDAIALVDRHGTISFANTRWRELLGIEGAELLGAQLASAIGSAGSRQLAHDLDEVFAGGRVLNANYRVDPPGRPARETVVSVGGVRDATGAVGSAVFIFHDVTSERQAERLKDELLSSASHELRTPLTSIIGSAQLLERQVAAGDTDSGKMTEHLQRIQREADRLAQLATELLDATRVEIEPEGAERVDLAQLASEEVERARELIGDGPWQIELDASSGPVEVRGEPVRLRRVMTNLLSNAVKYSPSGGRISVKLRQSRGRVQLSVTDEGIGIPDDDRERMFAPFFRASNAPSQQYVGLGLGLYLSRAIARRHGGELSYTSEVDRDTTFTLALPAAAPSEAA